MSEMTGATIPLMILGGTVVFSQVYNYWIPSLLSSIHCNYWEHVYF